MICVLDKKIKHPPFFHSLYSVHGSLHYRFGKTIPTKKNLNVKILLKPREKIQNQVNSFPVRAVVRSIRTMAFLMLRFLNLNRNLRTNK